MGSIPEQALAGLEVHLHQVVSRAEAAPAGDRLTGRQQAADAGKETARVLKQGGLDSGRRPRDRGPSKPWAPRHACNAYRG